MIALLRALKSDTIDFYFHEPYSTNLLAKGFYLEN
jgi:hypothetical protein